MNKNYYKILDVSEKATQPEIKKAYFAKAKMYHPDVCKDKDAEEKFKKISQAYETLNDEESRQKYDSYIHGSSNKHYDSNNYYDSSSREEEINYRSLFTMFSSKAIDISFYTNYINMNYKTEKEVVSAYSYFWLSFWSGGKGTIEMLSNKNATKIFKAFCLNPIIKQIKNSLTQEVRHDERKIGEINRLKDSIIKMNNSIQTEKISSQSAYNWMIRTINEDNIFDDESSMYYFLLISNEVYKLLEKFEHIYVTGSSIRGRSHYSNNTKAKGGGFLGSVITTIILIVFFRWIFK